MADEHAVGLRFCDFGVGDVEGVGCAGFFVLFDGFLEERGFHGFDAAEAPAGSGHFLDEFAFEIVGGLEAVDERGFEFVVGFLRFVRKDDAATG